MTQPAGPANAQSEFGSGSKRSLWLPALLALILLIAEVYVLIHDLGPGHHATQKEKSVAVFASGKNQVRQKSVGTIIWHQPNAGETIHQLDSLATMTDSEATVVFNDQSELLIAPDSLIVFEDSEIGKAGHSGKIVARLIRGSVRRKNSTPTEFLIKTSAEPAAEAYRLSDTRGDAVFKVVYQEHGIEVTVESGRLKFNGKDVHSGQQLSVQGSAVEIKVPKLPSPVLKKPEIDIRKLEKHSGIFKELLNLFWIVNAMANESRWTITVHFSWDAVSGADSYRIQISRDLEFHTLVLDQDVRDTRFEYQSDVPAEPQTLFMRVAGRDTSGNLGEFSALEKIHIRSVSDITREMEPEHPTPTPSPSPTPTPKHPVIARPKKITPLKKPRLPMRRPSPETAENKITLSRVEISYGIAYQSRTFKNSTSPTSVSASGLVPALLAVEFTRFHESATGFRLGASYLVEVATAGSSGVTLQNDKLGTPEYRIYGLLERNFDHWTGGVGPCVASTSEFKWNRSVLADQSKMLAGLMADYEADIERENWADVKANLALLAAGGFGIDAAVSAEHPIWHERVYFVGAGLRFRMSASENSYGGALNFGRVF